MGNDALGKLANADSERDAIHVAIAPVTSEEKLFPGQEVSLVVGSTTSVEASADGIGIVDPFLRTPVHPGQRFYIVLHPNTITSLRHDWSHPAFGPEPQKALAEEWLRTYARQVAQSYESLIEAANDYLDHGQYLIEGGRYEGEYVPDEFWDHFQKATGRMVDSTDRGSFFSCSC